MSAGNYGVVCQNCTSVDWVSVGRDDAEQAFKYCDTCSFHLARLRERAAIAAMQRFIAYSFDQEKNADFAVKHADALIAALKGGE